MADNGKRKITLESAMLAQAIQSGKLPHDTRFRSAIQGPYSEGIDDALGAAYGIEGFEMPEWIGAELPAVALLYTERPRHLVAESGVDYYCHTDAFRALVGDRNPYDISTKNDPVHFSRAVWRRLIGHFSLEITAKILESETVGRPGGYSTKKSRANWHIDRTVIRDEELYDYFIADRTRVRSLMHGLGEKATWLVGGMLFIDNHFDLEEDYDRLVDYANREFGGA